MKQSIHLKNYQELGVKTNKTLLIKALLIFNISTKKLQLICLFWPKKKKNLTEKFLICASWYWLVSCNEKHSPETLLIKAVKLQSMPQRSGSKRDLSNLLLYECNRLFPDWNQFELIGSSIFVLTLNTTVTSNAVTLGIPY